MIMPVVTSRREGCKIGYLLAPMSDIYMYIHMESKIVVFEDWMRKLDSWYFNPYFSTKVCLTDWLGVSQLEQIIKGEI